MELSKSAALSVVFFTILLTSICSVHGRLVDMNANAAVVTEVVARCRATCLEKFLFASESNDVPIDECLEKSSCWMCWDFCQFLHKEKRHLIKNVCSHPICVSSNSFRQFIHMVLEID